MNNRERAILSAAMLITFVLGSIHSFSVFLVPLEQLLQTTRANVSLLYSFALIALTISVLIGYRIYHIVSPSVMLIIACGVACLGLIGSSLSTGWLPLFFCYSLLFGFSNGLGYGYCLQLVARELSDAKGFAMAAVTAAYAVGSVVFSLTLAKIVGYYSSAMALMGLGAVIFLAGIAAAVIMRVLCVRYDDHQQQINAGAANTTPVVFLWFTYGSSVFAGLMAIGHAAGIIQAVGGYYEQATWGAVFIGIGSSLGGFIIGWLIKPGNINTYLIGLPLISAICLFALALTNQIYFAIGFLSCVGFAYGALISVYPYAISEYFGNRLGPKVYGQVFTAWGLAGLLGPWSAGKLFDYYADYSYALIIGSLIAVLSSLGFFLIRKRLPLNTY